MTIHILKWFSGFYYGVEKRATTFSSAQGLLLSLHSVLVHLGIPYVMPGTKPSPLCVSYMPYLSSLEYWLMFQRTYFENCKYHLTGQWTGWKLEKVYTERARPYDFYVVAPSSILHSTWSIEQHWVGSLSTLSFAQKEKTDLRPHQLSMLTIETKFYHLHPCLFPLWNYDFTKNLS